MNELDKLFDYWNGKLAAQLDDIICAVSAINKGLKGGKDDRNNNENGHDRIRA